uniref:F-box protein At1g70590 isoform X3 n=1 Tax=Rhizophora mucronata TaxID=61149 RepID=A0A2P2JV01_RHIMU
MLFLKWGKRFKHGRGGVKANVDKALDSFLKGAALGSTLAMVDAGLLYWELGNQDEAIVLYLKAAELGDPSGQCNLGISYLQVEPAKPEESVKWLSRASIASHVRAQYQLGLCLRNGRGIGRNLQEAV